MPTLLDAPPATDTAAVAAFYAEHGFYRARGLLPDATLSVLTRDFDRIVEQLVASDEAINARWNHATTTAVDGDAGSVVIHTHQVQKYSAAWGRFLYDPCWLDTAAILLGPDIVLHHSKLFLKPAGRGAAFPPHQDHDYFPTLRHQMLAAVVYLSDADDRNGCLRVWPGSHKHGPIRGSLGDDERFTSRFPLADSLPVEVAAGDVVFFSYLTVHASLANRSDRPRKSVLLQLHGGHDACAPDVKHPDSALVLRGWNSAMTRSRANAG